MICACFAYGADVVVSAIISGNFKIDDMIMKVSDILLCFYTISLLVEITSKAGKQYLHKQAEELEEANIPEHEKYGLVPGIDFPGTLYKNIIINRRGNPAL